MKWLRDRHMELFSTKAYKTVPWIWQPIQTINHSLDRIKVPQWMEWIAAQTGDRLSQNWYIHHQGWVKNVFDENAVFSLVIAYNSLCLIFNKFGVSYMILFGHFCYFLPSLINENNIINKWYIERDLIMVTYQWLKANNDHRALVHVCGNRNFSTTTPTKTQPCDNS